MRIDAEFGQRILASMLRGPTTVYFGACWACSFDQVVLQLADDYPDPPRCIACQQHAVRPLFAAQEVQPDGD